MRVARYFTHLILIMALLASGLPSVIPGDVNRDDRVDLADAVLGVRSFSMTAENPQSFANQVTQAVNALKIAAGLTTVIKPLGSDRTVNKTLSLSLFYVTPGDGFTVYLPCISTISEEYLSYTSITGAPAAPPPRSA